jgi:putative ubiquitin-RnfH superfamily antitoxin RatB of RatAB toxin-antitoxin module
MPNIELVYGDVNNQTLISFEIETGQTIRQVLERELPSLPLENQIVGIWNSIVVLDTVLQNKDRIELYRPLLIDPKVERRKRGIAGSRVRPNKRKNIRNYRLLHPQVPERVY